MDTDFESLSFLNALAGLATRLAAEGVEIFSVTYTVLGFGGWELESGRRRVRIRVTWDGKDHQLRVATAPLVSGSTGRNWQLAEEHDLRKRRPDLGQLFEKMHAAIVAHAGL